MTSGYVYDCAESAPDACKGKTLVTSSLIPEPLLQTCFKNAQHDEIASFMFLNAPGINHISNNLGDAESLITRPATTTNQRLNTEKRAHL